MTVPDPAPEETETPDPAPDEAAEEDTPQLHLEIGEEEEEMIRRRNELAPIDGSNNDIIRDPETGQEYSASRLTIALAEETPQEEIDKLLEAYHMEVIYDWRSSSMIVVQLEREQTAKEMDALITRLNMEEIVLEVEKDYISRLDDPIPTPKYDK